jgi:hypothetical protein
MAVEMSRLESNVRRAYERGRLVHAATVSAPLLGLATLVLLLLDHRPAVLLGLGGLLFAMETLFVWRGQQLGRGALAGLAGGAIPLTFGLCMQIYRRMCGGFMLIPGCTAVCTAGGLLAGLWIAWVARKQPSPPAFVLAAGATALVVGSIGCACAGTGGLVGLLAGLLLPVAVERVQSLASR